MLDVQNPEIDVDDIMRRIQEKVRIAAEHPVQAAPPEASMPAQSIAALNQHLARAREFAQVGAALPPMTRTTGPKRAVAMIVARMFLRMAQLITRDQRQFNESILATLQVFLDRLVQQNNELGARLTAETRAREDVAELARSLARDVRALRDQFGDEIGALRQQTAVLAPKVDQAVTAIAMQERRLTTLLEEVGKRRQEPLDRQQLQRFADELEHVSDAGYLNFEDAFRGSRDDIKQRVAVYLPKLRETSGPILDVGCGRGELLEVLRDAGLKASGVDSNAAAVELCRRAGLDVVQGDLFEVLARTPAGSLGGVTALHVVEHVPHALLLKLLDEVVRVLQPGGVAVFETPNPENVRVGATTFYLDPTHRNPVHPQTLRFLAEARGLSRVEMLPLHPCPDEMRIPEDTPVARRFNDYFYGPQDYAVLGRRP